MTRDIDTVMTIRGDKKVVDDFETRIKELSLRRDVYMRHVLENELDSLESRQPNTEQAYKLILGMWQARRGDRRKIGMKFPRELVDRINQICAAKRIPRDLFIESILRFLAYGWEKQDVRSPLVMAAEYLKEPTRDITGDQSTIYDSIFMSDEVAKTLHSIVNDFAKPRHGRRDE